MLKSKKKVLFLVLLILLLPGCNSSLNTITDINDLHDKKVGVYTGSEYDVILEDKINGAIPTYYNSYSDEISALKAGKIDGFLSDEPLANDIIRQNEGLTILNGKLTTDSYAFAIDPSNKKLKTKVDEIIKNMKSDGTLKKIADKWLGEDEEQKTLEKYTYDDSKGKITFATVSGSAPFAYMKNNELVGYDIEVIKYICKELGYRLDIVEMSFDGIIPALVSGKIDIAGCSIIVTEERKKSVLFSEATYTGGIVVVVRGKNI